MGIRYIIIFIMTTLLLVVGATEVNERTQQETKQTQLINTLYEMDSHKEIKLNDNAIKILQEIDSL